MEDGIPTSRDSSGTVARRSSGSRVVARRTSMRSRHFQGVVSHHQSSRTAAVSPVLPSSPRTSAACTLSRGPMKRYYRAARRSTTRRPRTSGMVTSSPSTRRPLMLSRKQGRSKPSSPCLAQASAAGTEAGFILLTSVPHSLCKFTLSFGLSCQPNKQPPSPLLPFPMAHIMLQRRCVGTLTSLATLHNPLFRSFTTHLRG
mmetsp:Transcript_35309/g.87864  ORF Transcript_35309/g.87864 Transcript_35309/m.87864 type:complete len:201 (-) Transcript_35309:18-620(-)